MAFGESTVGGAVLVKADGRIDMSSADAFKDSLLAAVSAAKRAVIVDMAGVDYISSAGLRTLLLAYRHAQSEGSMVMLTGLRDEVRFVMSATGFLSLFEIEDAP